VLFARGSFAALGFTTDMKSTANEMIETLEEVRLLLAQSVSPWSTQEPRVLIQALEREIACLRTKGRLRWFGRRKLRLLFAPTGNLQETSISGGWADKFLALSSRFDAAMEEL
jgi:hypothetical protein